MVTNVHLLNVSRNREIELLISLVNMLKLAQKAEWSKDLDLSLLFLITNYSYCTNLLLPIVRRKLQFL